MFQNINRRFKLDLPRPIFIAALILVYVFLCFPASCLAISLVTSEETLPFSAAKTWPEDFDRKLLAEKFERAKKRFLRELKGSITFSRKYIKRGEGYIGEIIYVVKANEIKPKEIFRKHMFYSLKGYRGYYGPLWKLNGSTIGFEDLEFSYDGTNPRKVKLSANSRIDRGRDKYPRAYVQAGSVFYQSESDGITETIYNHKGYDLKFNSGAHFATLSPDGRYILFVAHSLRRPTDAEFVGLANRPKSRPYIYVFDRENGELAPMWVGEYPDWIY